MFIDQKFNFTAAVLRTHLHRQNETLILKTSLWDTISLRK